MTQSILNLFLKQTYAQKTKVDKEEKFDTINFLFVVLECVEKSRKNKRGV